MKFTHGQKVTCNIDGIEITDAMISIDDKGVPYICQNEIKGAITDNKLGYEYSWQLNTDFTEFSLTNLKPLHEENLEETFYSKSISTLIADYVDSTGYALQNLKETKNNNIMTNIKNYIKNLALTSDEKLLRKYNLKTECGEYTEEAKALIIAKLCADNEAYLIEIVKGLEAEENK